MDSEEILICQKHKKRQKKMNQISANYYICMNRYCPNAYTVLCSSCKLEHRDHQIKVLSIQDIAFLIDRLLKLPFKQVATFIHQSVQVLKKVKLISQFTGKIGQILMQLQQEVLDYIDLTEKIVSQYAQCKNSAQEISYSINEIETRQLFQQFKKNKISKLSKLDYNVQKDILQYGNLDIKQKQDGRKKVLTYVRRKIQQVKQYSMKIIEVILNNDQSDDQEQDLIAKKKSYENLKLQVKSMKKLMLGDQIQKQLNPNTDVSNQKIKIDVGTSTENRKQQKKIQVQRKQLGINTDNKWIQQLQKTVKQLQKNTKVLESQLESASMHLKKTQTQYKIKLLSLQRQFETLKKQKDTLKREKEKVQKNYEQKCQFFNHYEHRLRDNHQKRNARYKQRQQIIKQLTQLIQHHRVGTRGSSLQKQNRNSSRPKKF